MAQIQPTSSSHPPPQWVLDLSAARERRTSSAVSRSKTRNGIPDPPGYSAKHSSKRQAPSSKKGQQAASSSDSTTTTTIKTPSSNANANANTNAAASTSPSSPSSSSPAQFSPEETDTLKLKKAWEVALAPAKQLPMNALMMYMSGNSLQIFSIMMVWMLFTGPLRGLAATRATFARFESSSGGSSGSSEGGGGAGGVGGAGGGGGGAGDAGAKAMRARLRPVRAVYVLMQLLALALGVWKINAMGLLPVTRSDWLAWETARQPMEQVVFAFDV